MKYQIIPVTPYQQNCSLIWCNKTMKAAVIDPGGDRERILAEVNKLGVTLEKVLLTHGHIDHVGAAKRLAEHLGIQVLGPHKDDEFLLETLPEESKEFGFPACEILVPDEYLDDGVSISVGELTLTVIHCPGHTPGHVVFYSENDKRAWVGDVLFHGSIGRTDFPRSNHQDLINSITKKLWPLGREVEFVPGHGPISTFGNERDQNPFVADQLFY